MSFKGAIDFQQPVRFDTEEVQVFYAYESNDAFVLPDALAFALTDGGRPDFRLSLVKAKHLLSALSLYGTLDLRLALQYPLEKAKAALKKTGSNALVMPATFNGGYLQLQPVNNSQHALAAGLGAPIKAGWNLIGHNRFVFRLDAMDAALIKESLLTGTLLFKARATLEQRGIAARLPLSVRFNPYDLLQELHQLSADDKGLLQIGDVRSFLNRDPDLLPLTITGDRSNELPGLFAEALTDRLLTRFGNPAPPMANGAGDYFSLLSPADAGNGIFDWDLSQTLEVVRILTVELNPILAASQLAEQNGGIENSLKEVLVPVLQTGFKGLHVSAIMPAYRPNVLSAGLHITAAPNAPARMQAISETINFTPPIDSTDIVLRFSPAERGDYSYEPFMIVKGINGTRKINGASGKTASENLCLNTDDFAVDFIMIGAAPDVLKLARLSLSLTDTNSGNRLAYEINQAHPWLSVCFPKADVKPANIQIKAISLDTGATISVDAPVADETLIGLNHFAGYGYHTVSICCNFINDETVVTIELLVELPDADTQPSLCFFTPLKSCKEWSYFADSPFACGYRYRRRKEDGSNGEWSDVQSPFVPLSISSLEP